MTTYATNHTRPWMDMVEMFDMPEDEAKKIFDRIEPCKTMEERYQRVREMIIHVKAEYRRRG